MRIRDLLIFFRPAFAIVTTAALVAGLPPEPAAAQTPEATEPGACRPVGAWIDPATGARLSVVRLMEQLAKRRIVLLGERHDAVEHHRWQLYTLAGLQAHWPRLVAGFEMFPRSVQPALDAWSKGETSAGDFLKAARWSEVWGYDSALYLPLFHFVRQHRLPMVALNVDRALVARVGEEGWRAVARDEREGLSDPAPATEAYRHSLAQIYLAKRQAGLVDPTKEGGEDRPNPETTGEAADLAAILGSDDFARFVEAQLTWDRAMAEALVKARDDNPDALIVGVLGRGHIEYGYGVPHQLADLGEDSVAVLLPVEIDAACQALEPGVADAAFLLASADDAQAEPAKPRLGILIGQADGGIRVLKVFEGSVAETTGLVPDDIILSAAGLPVARTSDLIEIVHRQAPGTWLPLEVRRDGATRQFVAKFPTRFE